MRTFELQHSSRFWTIERQGKKVTVTYGKIGGKPTSRAFPCVSAPEAVRRYQRQIGEKLAAGYAETTRDDTLALDPIGDALESALVENPDDLAAHMAFADYLSEQPDPRHQARGEFVRVQLQLESESLTGEQRKKLKKREKELLAAHERTWLGWRLYDIVFEGGGGGGAQPQKPDQLREYRRGWLARFVAPDLTDDIALALTQSPATRLLRRLTIEDSDPTADPISLLADSDALANLRVLHVNEVGYPELPLDDFIERLPRLEELHILAMDQQLDRLFALKTFTNLRELHIEDAAEFDIAALAKNASLGRLERLELWPDYGHADEGPPISLQDVRALAKSKHLKSLTHLSIHRTDAGDDGVREIVRSGILKRLRSLDLGQGCVTDRGALELASSEGFRDLEALSLSDNRLTEVGIAALRREGLKLNVSEQQEADEDGEYDDDYLYDDWDDSDYYEDDWE